MRSIFYILVLLTASFCFADEVVLKNGKILKGEVIGEDQELILLKDPTGIKLHIKKTTIDSVRKEQRSQEKVVAAETPVESPAEKPKKKARVYKKEDVDKMPELSIVGDEESPDIAALKNEMDDRAMREKESEAAWNEAALAIDDQIQEAQESYDANKSICDKVVPSLNDFPAGVYTQLTAEQYEERRRIACMEAEDAAKDLKAAQADYEELLEDARKKGIPPGWVDPARIRN